MLFRSNYFNKLQGVYIGKPGSGVTRYEQDLSRQAYTNGYLRDIANLRITYKATEKSKFNFSQNFQKHCDCFRGVDGLLAPEAVAQRLYGRLGFVFAYRYHYRSPEHELV